MREYIITIDDWFFKSVHERYTHFFGCPIEEIVRCRDCYFGKKVYWPTNSKTPSDWLDCMGPMVETWDYWNDEPKDNPVPPNGFCAWGERRTDDN